MGCVYTHACTHARVCTCAHTYTPVWANVTGDVTFPIQSTWSKATWEIKDSEHIDFSAADPSSGPGEELPRKQNHPILLEPGSAMPAILSSLGWGHCAAAQLDTHMAPAGSCLSTSRVSF